VEQTPVEPEIIRLAVIEGNLRLRNGSLRFMRQPLTISYPSSHLARSLGISRGSF